MKTNLTPDKAGQKLMDKINTAYKIGDKMRVKQDDGSIEIWTVRHPATYMCGDAVIWCNEHSSAYLAERVVFPSILYLTLNRKWYDMILSGEKTEEYREIKPYWVNRLLTNSTPHCDVWGEHGSFDEMANDLKSPTVRHRDLSELMTFFQVKFKHFDAIRFTNGYSKNAPSFEIECLGIRIGNDGKTEWGFMEQCFIISLGKIITKTTHHE